MKNSALQLHINLQQIVYTWVLKQTGLLSFRGRQMEYLISTDATVMSVTTSKYMYGYNAPATAVGGIIK